MTVARLKPVKLYLKTMKLQFGLFTLLAIIATYQTLALTNYSDYANNIIFKVKNSQGATLNFTMDNNSSFTQMCPPPSNWTIVSHAWDDKRGWVDSVVNSFLKFRGGCVMFMDYGIYSALGYSPMVLHFNGIVGVIIEKFKQLEQLGYDPGNGWLFSNGFSSHLFFVGAYNYSPCTIGRLDACDPAKPQYLNNSKPVQNAKKATKNVICYHTSIDYGTDLRYCQKDIDFGRCGVWQPATVPTHFTSHQLCPYLYNNTFTVDFDIVPKYNVEVFYKTRCYNKTVVPTLLPNEAIHVGPRIKTCIPNGEYYVLTSSAYPYNIASNYTG